MANIMFRVDPEIKEQAELVLDTVGMSMSTALNIYLRQIALYKKIPFEISMPVSYGALTENQFDDLMENAFTSAQNGKTISLAEAKEKIYKD